ncbi:sugar transferase [Synechococcus sp. RSCCF101]|uniref:sugar transferase n=1 Tax=Synechococcus sp. RSCCF101 TaxID=2511069 RepID=UPI001248A257|nr:sugar transferase [Synechococcus sp. RSCCF101]QEY32525.1 sugar transferase [Synechococcus sp. RSCCF101]
MRSPHHRRRLLLAAGLDGLGLVLLAVVVDQLRRGFLERQLGLLLVLLLTYWLFSWLFGSYTLLRLTRPRPGPVLLRLAAASLAGIAAGALIGWSIRADPDLTLLHRGSLIPLFGLMALWSGLVRLGLRRCDPPVSGRHWRIVARADEVEAIRREWLAVGGESPPPILVAQAEEQILERIEPGVGVAMSPAVLQSDRGQRLGEQLASRGSPFTSLALLAEQELSCLPPRWVTGQWLLFSQRIDGGPGGFDRQLKRAADLSLAALLLVVASPLLLLAALLIRLQDGGSVLYQQERSGLLGHPFTLFKLRSMRSDAESGEARWSQPSDDRITPIGAWLRRTRLDELPQLINVIRGDMSLIGPRPERPELEVELEQRIPNYRLRHWIRPGLSGWAQVHLPYGSSVGDAERKLGFDLYYLRNASLWLDGLILLKTIKTVLKGAGR